MYFVWVMYVIFGRMRPLLNDKCQFKMYNTYIWIGWTVATIRSFWRAIGGNCCRVLNSRRYCGIKATSTVQANDNLKLQWCSTNKNYLERMSHTQSFTGKAYVLCSKSTSSSFIGGSSTHVLPSSPILVGKMTDRWAFLQPELKLPKDLDATASTYAFCDGQEVVFTARVLSCNLKSHAVWWELRDASVTIVVSVEMLRM